MEHAWLVIYVALLLVIIALTGLALWYLRKDNRSDRYAVALVFVVFFGAVCSVVGMFLLVELLQNGVLK